MNIKSVLFSLISLILLVGCELSGKKNDSEKVSKSVLIYMASNNTLHSYATLNMKDLVENYSLSDMNGCKLIIYHRGYGEELPRLLELDNNSELTVIKTYPTAHNSADKDVLSEVIADFKKLYSADSYGCIFWSHGSAWLPSGFTGTVKSVAYSQDDYYNFLAEEENEEIKNHPLYDLIRKVDYSGVTTRCFGQDGTDWMEIEELSDAMSEDEFDFIIFDACYMSSVEVAYELRDKADLLMVAPTEVLGEGLEYECLAKDLFVDKEDLEMLKGVSQSFTDKYSESTSSIIDLTKMEAFAQEYKSIMANVSDRVGSTTPYNVQRYDRYSNHVVFDLVDYVSNVADSESAARVEEMVKDIVVYKYATDSFLGISLNNVSGISSYIPFENYTITTPFYKSLRWYSDILEP